MDLKLKNKVVVVTGAGSGLGKGIALCYGKEGAKVVVADINEESAKETAKEILEAGGESAFCTVDVSDPSQNKTLVDFVISTFGRLDIAVNNAGISTSQPNPVGDYDINQWDNLIKTDLSGVFYGAHYQIKAMEKTGGGVIILMSSLAGYFSKLNTCAYVAAKHGLIGLGKSIASEYGLKNIRSVTIGPGFIETPMVQKLVNRGEGNDLIEISPMKRLGKIEEVADVVVFLSCPHASFVNGSYHLIDGGSASGHA